MSRVSETVKKRLVKERQQVWRIKDKKKQLPETKRGDVTSETTTVVDNSENKVNNIKNQPR